MKKSHLIITHSNNRSTLQVITYSGMAVAALMLVQYLNINKFVRTTGALVVVTVQYGFDLSVHTVDSTA